MTQWQVNSLNATQIVAAGDPQTLIVNKNTKYGVLIGNNTAVGTGNLSDATPLGPYESLVVDGLADVFCVGTTPGVNNLVIAQTNAILWTPKAVQPNIADSHSPYVMPVSLGSVTLSVPPGAQGLVVSWQKIAGSVLYFTGLEVSGARSGLVYVNIDPSLLADQTLWIPILSDIDSQVIVTTTSTLAEPLVLVWIMVPFMSGNVDTGVMDTVNIQGVAGGTSVGVFEQGSYMYANQPALPINLALGVGAVGNILPAVAGRTYRLHDIRIEPVAASQCYAQLQDTSGATTYAQIFQEIVGAPATTFRPPMGVNTFHGAPLPIGLGLQLLNSAGVSQQYIGYITYSF